MSEPAPSSENRTEIQFLFDFISPYAYLAWTQIHALAERHGRTVRPVPILFAALLDAHGHKGPAEIPAKRVWVWKDATRTAAQLGVVLEPPPGHPFNPLLGLRVASLDMDEGRRRALIDGLFREVWGGGGGITEPETVGRIAQQAGLDPAWALAQAASPEIKERVKAQTARAIAAGAFGVPTMIVDDPALGPEELFWGFDSFRWLELYLTGKDPLDRSSFSRWAAMRPLVTRPGASR